MVFQGLVPILGEDMTYSAGKGMSRAGRFNTLVTAQTVGDVLFKIVLAPGYAYHKAQEGKEGSRAF